MKITHKKSVVWLRRDLRLLDHTALSQASKDSDNIVVAFVFDTEILKKLKNKKDQRLTFIYDSLKGLDNDLQKHGSKLIVLYGDPVVEIPKLIKNIQADSLYCNEDYEPYAVQRDQKVKETLKESSIPMMSFKDQVIFSGGEVLKADGTPYQIFTPYKKVWLKTLKQTDFEVQKVQKKYAKVDPQLKAYSFPSLKGLGFERANFFYDFQKPGRKNAIKHLKAFSKNIEKYKDDRDYPDIHGTSGLSVHLRFGTISVRECLRLSLQSKSYGHQTWLSELIWRDFYQMILSKFPHVKGEAFKKQYNDLKWEGSPKNFKAWCDGKTGYPIVDAAMRQLNQTGWMHNRLRMITASFLTKDLLIDWKKGESYFAEKLLDFDLASNNGGWQWSASTGCDAQPYFRIFNPLLQSQKFDPEGNFIRKWVPELKDCFDKSIHAPQGLKTYPAPIVDHKEQKDLAIDMYQKLRK